MQHQITQQAKFGRAEVDGLTGARHPVRGGIDFHIGELHYILRGAGLGPPHHRTQTGDEFARAERLDDIVVGAAVETAHPVGLPARAVNMITGSERVSRERRMRRQTSIPETSGSIQSSSTRSGLRSAICTSASSPSPASQTEKPSFSRL